MQVDDAPMHQWTNGPMNPRQFAWNARPAASSQRPGANASMGPRGQEQEPHLRQRLRWARQGQGSGIHSPFTIRHSPKHQVTKGLDQRSRNPECGTREPTTVPCAMFRVELSACQELGTGILNSEPGTLNSEPGTLNLEPVQWNAPCGAFSFAATEQPQP